VVVAVSKVIVAGKFVLPNRNGGLLSQENELNWRKKKDKL